MAFLRQIETGFPGAEAQDFLSKCYLHNLLGKFLFFGEWELVFRRNHRGLGANKGIVL